MFSKLKDKLGDLNIGLPQQNKQRKINISFLNDEELKQFQTLIKETNQNLTSLHELSTNNNADVKEFIKEQEQEKSAKQASTDDEEQTYTFLDDIEEMKELTKQLSQQIQNIINWTAEFKKKINSIQANESADKVKSLELTLEKKEQENVTLKKGEENMKEILNTLTQQNKLYQSQTKNLQEKCTKLQKDFKQTSALLNNLRQEKQVLLQMRNTDSVTKNPEVQALKTQLSQFDKRLTLEKTKNQQKEKQIQNLKKKLEEDRESLQKIADELKEKELKSKKILDKYERSKVEIRKFREEKNEFIKKLNVQVADLNEKCGKITVECNQLKIKEAQLMAKTEQLESELSKNQSKSLQLESTKAELNEIRQEMIQIHEEISRHKTENKKLQEANEQLQAKRKSLLEALEKPINHELKTLEKISRALDKLYKEYISVVFEEGNIVGFQNKIMTLKSNIDEIKEDLLL